MHNNRTVSETTLLILADDLTGALDTGIQFAKHDISTGVLPSAETQMDSSSFPEVLVINTETRHCSSSRVQAVISRCVRKFTGPDVPHIYKKTDSTLRGHIGAELEALMKARNTKQLPFVPAYPELGRTTSGGIQYLWGKPVDETEMALDPLNPITTSFIPGIIGEESMLPVRLIRKGEEIRAAAERQEILVFDGETAEDLGKIAIQLYKKNLLGESAGCAGFARALMGVLPFKKNRESPVVQNYQNLHDRPVLIISGSLHPVSQEQIKTALKKSYPGFAVDGEKLLQPEWFNSAEAKTLTASCRDALKNQGICILGTEMALDAEKAKDLSQQPRDRSAGTISRRLGELVREISEKTGPLVLAVFGGDTLLGVMKAMEFTYIRPLEEILQGVALARAEGKHGNSVIITKAGSFGDRDLVQFIVEYQRMK